MSDMRLPEVGTLFQSRYRLDAILGAGGFATVYRATDTMADRIVAVKVLKPELTGYPADVRSRFDQEVQMVANLRNEHTITLFDFGTSDEGLLFMLTEFVPGEDVSELLKRRGRLEPDEVVHILMQVLQSLREAHSLGLLHRDIKPANIRVFEYAGDPLCVRVLDFGIAKRMGKDAAGITKDGAIIGTPRYMSPEQLLQDELTPASDIYSLGVVAFELLMGSNRIHGTQLADQLSRLVTGHVFSIPELQRIGPDLCRVLDRMTARDRKDRFGTADEVYGALKALRREHGQWGSSDMIPVAPTNTTPNGLATPTYAPSHTPASLPAGFVPQTGSHERPIRPPPSTGTMTVEQPGLSPAMIGGFVALVAILVVAAVAAILLTQPPEPVEPPVPTVRKVQPTSIVRPTVAEEPEPPSEPAEAQPVVTRAVPLVSPGCNREAPFHGVSGLRVTIGLEMRSTLAYIPSSYDPAKGHALIVLLHENAEAPSDFIAYSELAEHAENDGAVLIAPNGGNPMAWEGPPRRRLNEVETAINDAMEELCIDPQRVYVVGHSAGGRLAEGTPCNLPIVKGIATTSFRGEPQQKHPCGKDALKHPVPHIHIAPLKDGYNPVKGGEGCSGVKKLSLNEKEEEWKTRNSCSGKRKVWKSSPHGTCYTWDCEAPFVSCHVKAGRNWDGFPGKRLWDHHNCDGPASEFPYADTIWEFLEDFDKE